MEGWHCREKLREGAALVGSSHGESLHTTGEELQFQTVPAECSSKAGGFLHVSTGASSFPPHFSSSWGHHSRGMKAELLSSVKKPMAHAIVFDLVLGSALLVLLLIFLSLWEP